MNPKKTFDNFSEFKKQIGDFFKKRFRKISYVMYVERSSIGRYHVHGTIEITKEYTRVNTFYNLLQEISESGLFSFKFGDQMSPDETKKYKTWEEYASKQNAYWALMSCESQFTNKFDPALPYNVWEEKPKPVRNPKPRKKPMTRAELKEFNDQLIAERDLINERMMVAKYNMPEEDKESDPLDDDVTTI